MTWRPGQRQGKGSPATAACDPGFVPCVGSLVSSSLEAGSVDLVFSEFPGSLGAAVSKGKSLGMFLCLQGDFTHEAVTVLTLFRH